MAIMDDILNILRQSNAVFTGLYDVAVDVRELLKQLKQNSGPALGVGESVATVERPQAPGGEPSASGAGTSAGAARGPGRPAGSGGNRPGLLARGAEYSANVARDLANPFTSSAEVGLNTLEGAGAGVGAAIGGFIGGPTGARIGASLGGAAGNAALSEGRFIVQSTKRDLLSSLSSLADQNIIPDRETAIQLRDGLLGRAKRQAQALKLGASVLDKDFLGSVLSGSGGQGAGDPAEDSKNLAIIARNTAKKKGSGSPSAGLTED